MYCEECGAELRESSSGCPRCGAEVEGRRRTSIRLGRAPDNDVVVEAPSVSRYHAEVRREADGRIHLVDLHSQAGTFVDGHRIGDQVLSPSQSVSLGSARVPDAALRARLSELDLPPSRPPGAGSDGRPPETTRRPRTAVRLRRALTHVWTRAKEPVSLGGVATVGVMNVLFGAVGLLLPTLFWLAWRIDRDAPGGASWLLALAVISALHQVTLFVGGMGLLLRRRWGRTLSVVWAASASAGLVCLGIVAATGVLLDFGDLPRAVLLAASALLIIYPVLVLFLLNMPSYRAALGPHGAVIGSSSSGETAPPFAATPPDAPDPPDAHRPEQALGRRERLDRAQQEAVR